jgi:predicted  nucleic acid-binding Zn ribbon protein
MVMHRYKGKASPIWLATVRDKDGRIIWSDNSGLYPSVHFQFMTEAAKIAKSLSILEEKGHVLKKDWNGVVDEAARHL